MSTTTIYAAAHMLQGGNFAGPPEALYKSHHWAKSHFSIDVAWLWIESRKMWVAQVKGWPRPVVFQVELKD